jgi:putative transposase
MPDYRRNRVPGGTFFFTVNLADRNSDLLVREIATLREAVRAERRRAPFFIDAWVVLPDHIHCIWTLPDGDLDFSNRWRLIKTRFARSLPANEYRTPTMARRRERGLWQRRFWEHTIRDEQDYAAHMDYTHFNPVKHGFAEHPADWPYSSFSACVARGVYDPSWAARGEAELGVEAGERR